MGVKEEDIKMEESEEDKGTSPVENMDTESNEMGEEKDIKPLDDNANNLEVKHETTDELESANNSLVADGAESGMNSLSAPVVAQQKVEIKMKINSSMVELERRESMMSSKSDIEESEFDPDAIT